MEEKVKVWWDEKDGIGRFIATDEITEDIITKVEEMFFKLAEEHDKTDWLIDLREFSKLPSSHARKRIFDLMKHHAVRKVAVITSKIAIRVVTNFVLVASGKTADTKFFSNEEEALKWLKKRWVRR